MNLPLLKRCQIIGVDWRQFVLQNPEESKRQIASLVDMCIAGKIRPRISQRFTLDQAASAIAMLDDRAVLGKLVVNVRA